MICTECGKKEAEEHNDLCFRCRVATVGFNWHGGGLMYGRKNWASRTNAEFFNEHVGGVSDDENYAPADRGVWS